MSIILDGQKENTCKILIKCGKFCRLNVCSLDFIQLKVQIQHEINNQNGVEHLDSECVYD